ncbi:MAG: nitroreductase family protein [Bacteroidia bacterium]
MDNTVNHSIHHLIENRKSIRGFATYQISEEELNSLFEAARWSFSAVNEQPWNYVYATSENENSFQQLLSVLAPTNQAWAKKSSVLIAVLAKLNYTKNNAPNLMRLHDVGAANMAMALQAVDLGLQLHPMGGFDKEKLKSVISISEDYEPILMMAIGKKGENPDLLPHQVDSENNRGTRFSIEEFAKKM